MRVAFYARVSTPEAEEKQDPEMQVREIAEFCSRRGWKTPASFVDRVSSAKLRPELERLKALCRRRRFDVVIVYRFDRFARSASELLAALEEFRILGIDFVSLHENIDTTTPVGKLVFTFLAGVAEFERAIIRERVNSGLALARSKGVRLGRPPRNPDIEQIRALRRSGHSWRHIAAVMGVPVSTVRRALLVGQKAATEVVQ
jgi:DNA invertase Pin-like site-specific DNA recombinase